MNIIKAIRRRGALRPLRPPLKGDTPFNIPRLHARDCESLHMMLSVLGRVPAPVVGVFASIAAKGLRWLPTHITLIATLYDNGFSGHVQNSSRAFNYPYSCCALYLLRFATAFEHFRLRDFEFGFGGKIKFCSLNHVFGRARKKKSLLRRYSMENSVEEDSTGSII